MKGKKIAALLMSIIMVAGITACAAEEEATPWKTQTQKEVSIHDPSIVEVKNKDKETEYYVFGSHIGQAKSKDLISWEVPFTKEYENMENNLIYGNAQENLAESFEWAGYDDGDHVGGYALWAPDVIWNPDYKWEKGGKKGAYMLYYSASSTWRRSCIGFAVSRTIEGPFEYGGTVVYSGFSEIDSTDGSTRNIKYTNTHIDELIEAGTLDGFNEKWVTGINGDTYNTDYAPNAIDPTLFYDEDGKLWMTYGSWSGGIYLLELDSKTGLPIYPGSDSQTEDGRVIDRYFGVKLAGGYHQSGEGPYIVYDSDAGYYYLYVTYGGLSAKGGYNMRLFRSEKVTGPYVDMENQTPIFDKNVKNTKYGIKVMGNYQLDGLATAYMAPGHNSALIDEEGNRFLVYHTRFNLGQEYHEVRIHQMFINAEGWPVTAVYRYKGDKMPEEGYQQNEIVGDYQFIDHGIEYSGKIEPTIGITLEEDGSISGDKIGSWKFENKHDITLEIDGVSYSGVTFRQADEDIKNPKQVMTFSAIGDNNHSIWGSQVQYTDEEFIQRISSQLKMPTHSKQDIKLQKEGIFGVSIDWRSQNPEWISNDGVLQQQPSEETTVILTATYTRGSATVKQDYSIVLMPEG